MRRNEILPKTFSLVSYKQFQFLIFDSPVDKNLHIYIQEFQKYNIKHIVRCCEPTYTAQALIDIGITVHVLMIYLDNHEELPFLDGETPTPNVISTWLNLISIIFNPRNELAEKVLGVHCVAGLGRSPLLVAIILIEAGLNPLDSVIYIRGKPTIMNCRKAERSNKCPSAQVP